MIDSTLKPEKLFLHFFDTHFIADKGSAAKNQAFFNEMRLATRFAVASANRIYIPAASYFESPECRKIIDEFGDLVDLGFIALAGSAINLDEYVRERQDEDFYRKGSIQHSWYRANHNAALRMPYERRIRSATRDVTNHWQQCVADESLARKLRNAAGFSISDLESRLEQVPENIGPLAFIPEHVFEILDSKNLSPLIQARIRSVINEGYFESYTRDLGCGVLVDLHHLASDFQNPSYGQNISYSKMLRLLRSENRFNEFSHCDTGHLFQFGNETAWQVALASTVTYAGAQTIKPSAVRSMTKNNTTMSSQLSSPTEPTISVLCIAAAQVELSAIHKKLTAEFGKGKTKSIAGGSHYIIEFTDSSSGACWNLSGQSFQGQVDAALNASTIIKNLNPTITLMVGMCMGMPQKNLSIGTVIVPNEVLAYDHQRDTYDGIQLRPHGDRVDSNLHNLAKISSLSITEYKIILDKGIASASTKIENSQSKLILEIEKSHPDVVAFDMEGSGFYRAAGPNCLWIKAIADSGESQNPTEAGRAEKHQTQTDATDNSVDFAITLVRAFVDANKNT